MTTAAASWLQSNVWADLALVLLFDGIDLGYTTHDDVAGLAAAWAGAASPRPTIKGGLDFFGSLTEQAKPFDAAGALTPSSLTFIIQDVDDTLISTVLKEAPNDAAQTELTQLLAAGATTAANVNSTTAAGSSGTIYIGTEQIAYAAKAAGQFQTLTRGKLSLFHCASGALFGPAHEVDSDTGNAGYRPRVMQSPSQFYNRGVSLYVCHRVNGVWSVDPNAILYWSGRIKTYEENGQGTVSLTCLSVHERLQANLLSRQFRGYLQEGMFLTAAQAQFRVHAVRSVAAGTNTFFDSGFIALPNTGSYRTHAQIASDINNQLAIWFPTSGGSTFPTTTALELKQISQQDGPHYAFRFTDSAAGANDGWAVYVFLHQDVWTLLGWDASKLQASFESGNNNYSVSSSQTPFPRTQGSNTEWRWTADQAPFRWLNPENEFWATGVLQIIVSDIVGGTAYVSQPTIPPKVYQGATGFLRVGDKHIFAVSKVSSTTYNVYQNVAKLIAPLGTFSYEDQPLRAVGGDLQGIRDDGSNDPIPVMQVWIETGTVGDMFAKLLLSTGTAAYNHATYDVYPLGMGVGFPASLFDLTSLVTLSTSPYVLVLEKPTPFAKLFANQLVLEGKYCTWRSDLGKLAIVAAGVDATAAIALTEDNKAKQVTTGSESIAERTVVRRNVDGIINRITLKYQRSLDDTYRRTIIVNALASQSDFQQARGITIECPGLYEQLFANAMGPGPLADRLLADVLAHFSRPTCIAERSYDFSLEALLYIGARVTIVDNSIVNPGTGTRGVNGLLGQVVGKSWDWRKGVGRLQVLFFPEQGTGKLVQLAPSARIDDTFGSGGFTRGYNSSTKTLRFLPNGYSDSSQPVDVSRFVAGDKVHIMQLSPSAPGSFTDWHDTVASVDAANNQLTLTTGLTSPTWASTGATGGFYVIEADVATTVTGTQLTNFAFLADPATLSTGVAARDFYVWGSPPASPLTVINAYTTRHRKPANNEASIGAPLSAHKLFDRAKSLQTFWAHHTVQHLINENFVTALANGLGNTLVYGPIQLPLYGGARKLVAKLRVTKVSGTGTATWQVITSVAPPTGKNTGILGGLAYKDNAIASSSADGSVSVPTWIDIPSWAPAVVPGQPPYCWLTIHCNGLSTFVPGLLGVHVREVAAS